MNSMANTIKICKKKYFLWLSVIAAGLICFCYQIGSGASGAVLLDNRLPVGEQLLADPQEAWEAVVILEPDEMIFESGPDIEQQLLELMRSSTFEINEPTQPVMPRKKSLPAKAAASSKWKTVRMRVTAYCACPICCGNSSDGITANMYRIRRGDAFVAADKKVPFGTRIIIPGYNGGRWVEVKDRGGLIRGNHIDLYFSKHKTAQKWGVKYLDVRVRRKD